jgi:hypothetical protein
MNCRRISSMAAIAVLAGCASGGSLLPPKALPAHLYSSVEKLRPGPWQSIDMDGEVRYCSGLDVMGGVAKGEELRKSALAQIAQVCGGEEKYAVVHQAETRETTEYFAVGGLVKSNCPVNTGRAIYFKCSRASSQPATTKTSK